MLARAHTNIHTLMHAPAQSLTGSRSNTVSAGERRGSAGDGRARQDIDGMLHVRIGSHLGVRVVSLFLLFLAHRHQGMELL